MAGDLIKPKEFSCLNMDGEVVSVFLSRFDAVTGREILAKYPISALPKLGDYAENHATMLKLMGYVAIQLENGNFQRLTTQALINNHVGDAETLMKIEMAMLEYNSSFFQKGRISDFFDEFVETLATKITGILTRLSAQSSPAEKLPSTN